jgi:adenosylhomocysteine nucleosidase
MKDIILIALPTEAPSMKTWDNVFFTGVGKVNAAITASAVIQKYKPETVWNFGTAGGITPGLNGTVQMHNFVQRDMMCCEFGFNLGQTPFEEGVVLSIGEGYTCSTGDNFVSDPNLAIPADVVDMEAYAIAKACQFHGVEFKCYKYISDSADENANTEWHETVANGESDYIRLYGENK